MQHDYYRHVYTGAGSPLYDQPHPDTLHKTEPLHQPFKEGMVGSSTALALYENFLLASLAERIPEVEQAFRDIRVNDILYDGPFKYSPARAEMLQDFRRFVHEYPSYEEGLCALLTSKGLWIDPNLDGIDHINVDMSGKTQLGRALAIQAPLPILVPGFGEFPSVFDFWERVAKKILLSEEYQKDHRGKPRPADLLVRATEIKVNSYPALLADFLKSSLKLVSYTQHPHFTGKCVVQHNSLNWLVHQLAIWRTEMRLGAERNFIPLPYKK